MGKTVGSLFDELIPVEVPWEVEYIKGLFISITAGRTTGMNGPDPISYMEMKAYMDIMDEQLIPYEIETIRMMDSAFIAIVTKEQPKDNK